MTAKIHWIAALLLLIAGACGTDDFDDSELRVHDEPADFIVSPDTSGKSDELSVNFDKNKIVSDAFFEDADAVDGDDIQAFLEDTPYGGRSWMADEKVNGVRAADLMVSAARAENINPVMLLIRLQVEQGLVSKTSRPSQTKVNRALGCGCYDGASCASQFRGFEKQMACGAQTHRKLFDGSTSDGAWRSGKAKKTSDRIWVTPSNHATAALYGYTPWVLTGRGGNWLVWNIAKKYVKHFSDLGHYHVKPAPWIGTPCVNDSECGFTGSGQAGFCNDFEGAEGQTHGFCTVMCEGFCPDRDGRAATFCVASEANVGLCASRAHELNTFCEAIPGTSETERDRFVGDSTASAATATVCVP